jgi:hypothetical protein
MGHITGSVCGQSPLASEVPLIAAFRISRDNGDKQMAVVDLLPDLAVPGIAAAQLALVKPDLDAACAECLANPLDSLRVLRGVASEHRSRRCARRPRRILPHATPLLVLFGLRENALCSRSHAIPTRASAFHQLRPTQPVIQVRPRDFLLTRDSGIFPTSQCRALVRTMGGIRDHHGVEGRRRRGGVTMLEKSYREHSRERGRVEPGRYADVPPCVSISGQQHHALSGVLAQYFRHNCVAGELSAGHRR